MSGSRLHRIGTIFTRLTGLINGRAVRYEDRPIWYDVYARCPPIRPPRFRSVGFNDVEPSLKIDDILYEEDELRSMYNEKVGDRDVVLLSFKKERRKSTRELFIERLINLRSSNDDKSENVLFYETTKEMMDDGFNIYEKKKLEKKLIIE
ncbi:hypothetical protein SNEBB_008953 [Seison nebaliae]|nr:hypothetical protein SNEBB_008953 [Seison nebaliae]